MAATNIGTGTPTPGVWVGPIGGSSWVSFEDSEPGAMTPDNGTYTFSTSFTATAGETLTLQVLADDTTSVWLNGSQVKASAASVIDPVTEKCDQGQPNCTVVLSFLITGLNVGSNTLTFGVDQDHDQALGLDFAGTLNAATPEPSSLLLLGTGLLGAAGALRRRIRA